jgi:hypothetical protein
VIGLDRQDRSDRDRAWQIVCSLPGVRRVNALIGLSVLSGLTAVAEPSQRVIGRPAAARGQEFPAARASTKGDDPPRGAHERHSRGVHPEGASLVADRRVDDEPARRMR